MNSDDLRAALLAGDLSRPRLTWYDEGSGERIDLSGKTLVNWVAKAANWLESEMSLEPGDIVRLDLPADHWRAIYWSLAAWTRGLTVTTGDDADASVGIDSEPASAGADLVEPAAALAASPLQAMSDAMPAPVGDVPCAVPAVDDVTAGSRVFVTDNRAAPALTAALIVRGCSVLVVRGGDERSRAARSASEAVDTTL
ncbi:MAG TPA: TIGR03089 family protein [Flexivirga sp.]|uniref:TIGR03089 family protein n=1 Tax=Flexivirga sp. TaxID=1962927 RepID=UPI002C87B8A0|nr:TIGR03089 family protein [Flexivirga sp.]HWC23339.1 TIGR03089 family protein [Flexivirga sp.]